VVKVRVGRGKREAVMIEFEEKLNAIRKGTTPQLPEIEAIGLVYVELLRPLTLEPLPWSVIDALRAVDRASRRETSPDV